jgi:hypothetical protein
MTMARAILVAASLALGAGLVSTARAQAGTADQAPKYLQINVEYTKPATGGDAHDKSESAFAQAMAKVKFPIHYTAYTAITGKPRTIYLSGFASFEEMEKAHMTMEAGGAGAEFDRLLAADGELLEDSKSLIFKSLPELSLHSIAPSAKNRMMEATIFQIKPGHAKDFEELAKTAIAVYDKIGSSYHWGAYRLTVSDSATDIDQHFAEGPKFDAAVSEEESKKMAALSEACIASSHREMYVANPEQSYVADDWIKADPFWKPKGTGKQK